MYNPLAAANASDYEFIELKNVGSTAIDLSDVRIAGAVWYRFNKVLSTNLI